MSKETANQFAHAICTGQYRPPAGVFCSHELEAGLDLYMEECIANLDYPSDERLRLKAREILGMDVTAADNPKLLETFKAKHGMWFSNENASEGLTPASIPL